MPAKVSERTLLLLIAAVQFVNVLDFVMVMPLGPDFAAALGIPSSELGLIGGSYTAAAAVSGLIGALFLEKFDRRAALGFSMLGLVIGTAAGAFATDLNSLIAARVLAGAFGGPATSIALSIIADVVPAERRGKAMGTVMIAFSVAQILGVPAGLELARLGGWRMPFFAVAGLGLVVVLVCIAVMPPLRGHLNAPKPKQATSVFTILAQPTVQLSLIATTLLTAGMFLVIPNISAFIQFNLGYPRAEMGILYLAGGIASFVAMRFIGGLVDRRGATKVANVGTALIVLVLWTGFATTGLGVPVIAMFIAFMLSGAFRNVAFNTLSTRVPVATERASYMSLQSAVQHLAAAAGAVLSAQFLTELPDHHLEGMPLLATVSIVLALLTPLPMWLVEKRVKQREREAKLAAVAVPA